MTNCAEDGTSNSTSTSTSMDRHPCHSYLPPPSGEKGAAGKSFWLRDHVLDQDFHNHRTTQSLPEYSDVVIIGGGFAGTATAWHLAAAAEAAATAQQPPLRVTLLEARGVCSGATGRNGGHLRPDLYGHIPTYMRRYGERAGAEIAEFEMAHVWAIKALVETEAIDCDFVLARTVDVWRDERAALEAATVYDQMRARGLAYMDDVFFRLGPEAEMLSGVKGARAVATYTAAMLSPYKLVAHLLKSLVRRGRLNLQTNTPVTGVVQCADGGGGFTIHTPRGTMRAGKVVHASNAYVAGLLPEYRRSIVPCKGLCCRITVPAGRTAPLLSNSYIERDADGTLSYLIPRPDGSIVVGGAARRFRGLRKRWYDRVDDDEADQDDKDVNKDEDGLIAAAGDYYRDGYMQRTFRGWEETGAGVDCVWTGVMGYSYDSNPHLGPVPARPGQFINAGFNGHGMPVIWLASEGLARMLLHGVAFEQTGLPALFRTTELRIRRALTGREEDGDIVGDGSLGEKPLAEELLVDESLGEKSLAEKSLAEKSLAKNSLAEKSLAEKSLADESLTDESLGEKAMGEKSLADDLLGEQPLREKSLGGLSFDQTIAA